MSTSPLQERLGHLLKTGDIDPKNLSVLAGLGSSHVGQIMRGELVSPSNATLGAIAKVTGASLAWLALGEGKAPSERTARTALAAAKAAHPAFREVA